MIPDNGIVWNGFWTKCVRLSYYGYMEDSALLAIANRLRFLILTITHAVSSGHPTTSFSSVEIMTMLFFRHLHADMDASDSRTNDRVIFSKGHASALFYSLYCVAGKISEEELKTYRLFGSRLEGHPTHRFPFTEAATGSLGQGLSIAVGEAEGVSIQTAQVKGQLTVPKVFCLLGDGELSEGSVWEAVNWAGNRKTSNIIAIVDCNGLEQSGRTMEKGNAETLARRFESFGWATIAIDGHDFNQIDAAYTKARQHRDGPVAIIAKTKKGKGIDLWEDKDGWHNKMLPDAELKKALVEFGKDEYKIPGVVTKPEIVQHTNFSDWNNLTSNLKPPTSNIQYTDPVPTKKALGNIMEILGTKYTQLLVLDADVSTSLHTEQFRKTNPEQFFPMHIAEQNMCGVAVGFARVGFYPVINTFAAFLTRAHDQLRMMPLSDVSLLVHGSYVGVSVGRDGPSQMGLEDLAMMRSMYGSTVVYPCDPYQTEYLACELLCTHGVSYIRTTREKTPVIYSKTDTFPVGGSHTFSGVGIEKITIVSAGITLHEALKAQKTLAEEQISVRVIDAYSIKPIDKVTLRKASQETGHVLIVEDHYKEGGLGDAVREALDGVPTHIFHLCVTQLPQSGSPEELLNMEGIDARAIIARVHEIIKIP
jgi:transketolase